MAYTTSVAQKEEFSALANSIKGQARALLSEVSQLQSPGRGDYQNWLNAVVALSQDYIRPIVAGTVPDAAFLEEARKYFQSAGPAVISRVQGLINQDKSDPTGKASEATIKTTLAEIQRVQEEHEPERRAAEAGLAPLVGFKAGETVGAGLKQVAGGFTQFLKQIPWWVYALGVGGAGLYFFGPVLLPAMRRRIAKLGQESAPVPQANPRRRIRR